MALIPPPTTAPAEAPTTTPTTAPTRAPLPAPSGGPAKPCYRVLVVEDEPDQLVLLSTLLRKAGCTVIAALTGEQALAAVADVCLELAVIDLRLPGMDGRAVADALRSTHPGCRIAITSVGDAEDYPPADAVLPKPFTRHQVLALLVDPREPVSR